MDGNIQYAGKLFYSYHHPLPQGSILLPCFHNYSSLASYFIGGGHSPTPPPQIKVGIRVGVTLADELESGSGDTGQCYPIPLKKKSKLE